MIGVVVLSTVAVGLVVGQSASPVGESPSEYEHLDQTSDETETVAGPAADGPARASGPSPSATTRWNASFVGDPGGSTVVDGTVYLGVTTHRDYNQRTGRVATYDASTGDVRWTRGGLGGVTTAPTVADGTVYAATDAKVSSYVEPADGDGGLYALDAETGETEWVRNTSEKWTGSPVLADGKLYAIRGPETIENETEAGERPLAGNRSLVALDPDTGATTWSVPADGLVGVTSDAIVATDGRELVTYDLTSHQQVWQATLPRGADGDLATVGADAVYVAASNATPRVQAYALSDGTRQWNVSVGTAGATAFEPTVVNGSLYATTTAESSSTVVRLDAGSGRPSWRFDRPVGDLQSAPAVGTDAVYVGAGAVSEREEPGSGASLPYQRSPAVIAIDAANASEQWRYLDRTVATDQEFDLGMERPTLVDSGLYLTASDSFMNGELSGGLIALESADSKPADGRIPTDGVYEDEGARPSVTITSNTTDPSEAFGENETVELTAHAAAADGTLAAREWDVDGDGEYEREGSSITITLEQCETRNVTARAVAESGASATATISLKNAA